jgi:hypothetical protein
MLLCGSMLVTYEHRLCVTSLIRAQRVVPYGNEREYR